MKIMYVNTLGVWGGVATYLKPLMEEQIRRGNEVSLVVGNNGDLTSYVSKKLPEVKIIILDTMERNVNILGVVKSIFTFRGIVKEIDPDIIHANCIMAGIISRLGRLFTKSKIIYNAHGWAFEPGTSKKFKYPAIVIEKILSFVTDRIICVSDYEKCIASKYYIFKNKRQAIVIKNACEDLGYCGVSNDGNSFTITMAARFWRQKNQKLLLEAVNLLINNNDLDINLKVNLLGDGPLLDECKMYVKNNNMEDIIKFTGMVTNVQEYYEKSNVIMLITNYDAIAISLIEALSLGKPIIASNVSGVPENFSNDKNGYCVNNDVEEISNAILDIILNQEDSVQMGINSRKLYEKDFRIERNIKLHNDLYRELNKK